MAHFNNWRFSRDCAWICDMLDPEDIRNSETPERFPDYGCLSGCDEGQRLHYCAGNGSVDRILGCLVSCKVPHKKISDKKLRSKSKSEFYDPISPFSHYCLLNRGRLMHRPEKHNSA